MRPTTDQHKPETRTHRAKYSLVAVVNTRCNAPSLSTSSTHGGGDSGCARAHAHVALSRVADEWPRAHLVGRQQKEKARVALGRRQTAPRIGWQEKHAPTVTDDEEDDDDDRASGARTGRQQRARRIRRGRRRRARQRVETDHDVGQDVERERRAANVVNCARARSWRRRTQRRGPRHRPAKRRNRRIETASAGAPNTMTLKRERARACQQANSDDNNRNARVNGQRVENVDEKRQALIGVERDQTDVLQLDGAFVLAKPKKIKNKKKMRAHQHKRATDEPML